MWMRPAQIYFQLKLFVISLQLCETEWFHDFMQSFEKLSTLHDLVAYRTNFSVISWSNRLLYDFFNLTFFWRILAHSSLPHCSSVLQSHHSIISLSLRCGLWLDYCNTLIFFFFSHSVVGLLLCLGSPSCWVTQFPPNLSCQTDVFTFDSKVLWYTQEYYNVPRSCVWKTRPNHHSPSTVLDGWHDAFVQMCCAWLLPHMVLCIVARRLHIYSKGHCSRSIVVCSDAREKSRSLGRQTSQNLISFFLIVQSRPLTFNFLNEPGRIWDVFLFLTLHNLTLG